MFHPHTAVLVALGLYRFLKDPHGVTFHTTRWVGGMVVKFTILALVIMISINVWAFSEHFIFHVPKQEIIRKMNVVNDTIKHWSDEVQKLDRKLA